jgi:hypothetical protein
MISEFSQRDLDARQGKEAFISFQEPIMPDQNAAFMAQPSERPFHYKAKPVAMRPRMLAKWRPPSTWSFVNPLRDTRHRAAFADVAPEPGAVVSPVRQNAAHALAGTTSTTATYTNLVQGPVRQLDLMNVGRFQDKGQRRPPSIDQDFPLGSFAYLGNANTTAPFLAGAKLASRMPCDNFNRPRFPSCPKSTRKTLGQTPFRCHSTNLVQQVVYAPYSAGMSFHRQPLLSTNKMPLIVLRSSARGRPRRFWRGNVRSIRFQSFADKSVSRMDASSLGVTESV